MKKNILNITFGGLLLTVVFGFVFVDDQHTSQQQVLRHVVLIDLNEHTTDSVVEMMNQDLKKLQEKITEIQELEFGTNIQEEADYSHCMFLTFESVDDLKAYEEHPMHLEFASTYGKYVVKKTEVDYWH